MKALTLAQPWAWAVFHADPPKLVENRTRITSHRGPLAIHAGRRFSGRGWGNPIIREQYRARVIEGGETTHFGAVLGIVNLVDVHPDAGCCRPWGESEYIEASGRTRLAIVHLVFEDPKPLDPPLVDIRGREWLWNLDDRLLP